MSRQLEKGVFEEINANIVNSRHFKAYKFFITVKGPCLMFTKVRRPVCQHKKIQMFEK